MCLGIRFGIDKSIESISFILESQTHCLRKFVFGIGGQKGGSWFLIMHDDYTYSLIIFRNSVLAKNSFKDIRK